jgi:cytochrome c biogenesis protein CcdA
VTGAARHFWSAQGFAAQSEQAMLRLIGIMISIGLADSFNPSTFVTGFFIATRENSRGDLLRFAFGVFAVYLVGGIAIAAGPGRLLLALVPRPSAHLAAALEIVAGAVLLVTSWYLISRRHKLRRQRRHRRRWRSPFMLGAGIMAFETPTALPYFAAIAAAVSARPGPVSMLILLLIYNVCFVAPLLLMVAVLTFAGRTAKPKLVTIRALIERHWPLLLGVAALIGGTFVITLGLHHAMQ